MKDVLQTLDPSAFPALLSEIADPPAQLYLKGTLPPDTFKFLTVVGSRRYTPYGKTVCEKLIAGLTGHPVAIVSGLALGMDAIAHEAALSAGLPTIAVPGSGLGARVLYPALNRALARKIVEQGGALLSEYAEEFRATIYSFPKRNRIMAGLSHATLVIEAHRKSGTLITARLASEYNREVLAVPGAITSSHSEGPHLLIRLGATPITTSADILEALHLPQEREVSEQSANLSPLEQAVLTLADAGITRDDLIRALHVSASEGNAAITSLELKGMLEERLGTLRTLRGSDLTK